MRGSAVAALAFLSTVLLTGCEQDRSPTDVNATSGAVSEPPPTTLTEPAIQPPRQKNQNHPDVVYDPCTYLGDQTVRQIGADPATRHRSDFVAEYTLLGCEYESKDGTVTISSSNIAMAEERARYKAASRDVDVNGRSSVIIHLPSDGPDTCALSMPTKEGFLNISSFLSIDALRRNVNPCDDLMRIAQIVEPTIGKGK